MLFTSPTDERIYHAPFIKKEELEKKILEIQKDVRQSLSCSRAHEQLYLSAETSINQLIGGYYSIDRKGNVDIHRSLIEQLKKLPEVRWIFNQSLLELLTLHQHSACLADVHKSPMCVGITTFNHEALKVERYLAKEVIIATGGATSLYPYSTHSKSARGEGVAIAWRAGARLVKMDQIQFHPLGFFERDQPCVPLSVDLLKDGGQLALTKHSINEVVPDFTCLTDQLYTLMLENRLEHLWLNLTMLDSSMLKDKYPSLDAYCLDRGLNIAKDRLPVVPVARYTGGGIAVDKYSQTSMQRLRAVGEAACTGLTDNFEDEAMGVIESLTWAFNCAEDIAAKLSKFIYYFPKLKVNTIVVQPGKSLKEDWRLINFIMWNYGGIKRDKSHLKRARVFLNQLQNFNSLNFSSGPSLEQIHLIFANQMALLIIESAINNCASKTDPALFSTPPHEELIQLGIQI